MIVVVSGKNKVPHYFIGFTNEYNPVIICYVSVALDVKYLFQFLGTLENTTAERRNQNHTIYRYDDVLRCHPIGAEWEWLSLSYRILSVESTSYF